ncbi:hypothetical protein [Streptomyces sviceus]|uniref:hypothetical protein n=1 Tax=Streptomyces sviceus TaxID=285530 RepID=UPI0036C3FB48
MTSAYTELTKEAAKRGGPAAFRLFYRGQGFALGAAFATVTYTGTQIYYTVRARRSGTTAATAPQPERAISTDAQILAERDDA